MKDHLHPLDGLSIGIRYGHVRDDKEFELLRRIVGILGVPRIGFSLASNTASDLVAPVQQDENNGRREESRASSHKGVPKGQRRRWGKHRHDRPFVIPGRSKPLNCVGCMYELLRAPHEPIVRGEGCGATGNKPTRCRRISAKSEPVSY
jgi:hypothetical protein